MTTVDYNELLYNKMKKEFDSFISELKTKPPEQIIEGSYEKVIKEDFNTQSFLKPKRSLYTG